MSAPSKQLTVEDVTLRRWQLADRDELAAAIVGSRAHLVPFLAWAGQPDQRTGTAEFLARGHAGWAAGTDFGYAILLAGRIAGGIGLMGRVGPGALEIGYWVGAAHTRRGVATRSAALCTAAGLALPGITRIEIRHDAANTAGAGVPRALGFRETGRITREPTAPGETDTEVGWQLTAADHPAGPIPALLSAWPGTTPAADPAPAARSATRRRSSTH